MASRCLLERVQGRVLTPGDPGYEDARRVWNGNVDRRPRAVLRCADVADVREAVRLAHERDLPVSVRGGGHAVAGHAVCDDGLVIDPSAMTGVRVDPAAGTARPGRRTSSAPSVRAAYGEDKHRRLVLLKRRYDPDNFFRRNHNIPPS